MFLIEINAKVTASGARVDFLQRAKIGLLRRFTEQNQLAVENFQAKNRLLLGSADVIAADDSRDTDSRRDETVLLSRTRFGA